MNSRAGVLVVVLLVLLSSTLLCVSCGGEAAESAGAIPLLSMLEEIPEDAAIQSEDLTYFADYSAMESAYGSMRPADAQSIDLPEDVGSQVWMAVFLGSSWVYEASSWQKSLTDGPKTVGFSPLDVDRAIQFGTPPGDGLMLAGNFDSDTVSAAYQENIGLSPHESDGATIWWWGDDPEDGLLVDVENVVRENPFGGFLGRRQPMVIENDLLMSSADIALVQAHLKTAAGEVASAADALGCRTAVDAVAEGGEVLQATIGGPMLMLPVTSLMVLADVVTADEQIARLGLVYADAESAEAAGPVLLDGLAGYPLQSGDTGAEMLGRLNVTDPRYYVREGTDCAVLVAEFPTPKAATAEIAKMRNMGYESTFTPPGLVYRFFTSMFLQRDTGWMTGIGTTG